MHHLPQACLSVRRNWFDLNLERATGCAQAVFFGALVIQEVQKLLERVVNYVLFKVRHLSLNTTARRKKQVRKLFVAPVAFHPPPTAHQGLSSTPTFCRFVVLSFCRFVRCCLWWLWWSWRPRAPSGSCGSSCSATSRSSEGCPGTASTASARRPLRLCGRMCAPSPSPSWSSQPTCSGTPALLSSHPPLTI